MMDMQAAPPTYAEMNTGQPPAGNPPTLGQQVPGFSGGLPAQGGLSVLANPMAQQLQSQGRGEDTMLVHMTPGEVNSLQGLAMAHGGSLTINPETGLPEAGWLGKLLPSILGAALAATGVGAPLAAGIVGLGSTAATGSLKKGLTAGLGAFGGASLAGAAGLGGKISQTGFGALSDKAGILGANMGQGAASTGLAQFNASNPSFFGRFAQTAKQGLPGGIVGKAAPLLAAQGVLGGVSRAMTPSGGGYMTSTGMVDNSYAGPYTAQKRTPSFAQDTSELLGSSKERRYFDVAMPEVYNMQGQVVQPGSSTAPGTPILQNYLLPVDKKTPKGSPMYGQRYVPYMGEQDMGYAEGGEVDLAPGGFVVDARTVSEAGNGYTPAGQAEFKKLGGIPLNGPGDGVSDSIMARIGNQPARVAAGEVYMPPKAVKRAGGADKLYAMMNRAHKATKRGQKRDIVKA